MNEKIKEERNLKNIINNRLGKILFFVIIILFLILLPLQRQINNRIIARSHQIIITITDNILGDFNSFLVEFETSYNNLFSELLAELVFEEEQLLSTQELSKENIKSEINDFITRSNNSLGIQTEQINYYLINTDGIIKETSNQEYLGFDFRENKRVWEQLKSLDSGEVLLQRASFSNLEKRYKKYGYIKLVDGYILRLAYPLAQDLFEHYHQQINNDHYIGIEDIGIYNSDINFSTIKEGSPVLDKEDKEIFQKLAQTDEKYIKGEGRYYQPIYIRWDLGSETDNVLAESFYLKVKTDISGLRLLKLVILLLSGGILFTVALLTFSFNKRLYDRILAPFSSLISSMNQFTNKDNYYNFEIEDELERTEIKEVNTLLATYQDMINELSANFEEVEAINEELDDSYQELERINNRFKEIIKLPGRLIDSVFNDEYEQFLSKLLHYGVKIIPRVDYGSIFILKDNYWQCLETIGHDEGLETIKIKKDCFSKFKADTFISSYQELMTDNCNKKIKEDFLKHIRAVKTSIISDLNVGDDLKIRLILDIAADKKESFANEDRAVMSAYYNVTTAALTMYQYNELQEKIQKEIIFTMINILELHDGYTKGHSEDVAEIAVKLSKELQVDREKMDDIYWAGLVHDIGKILISRGILNKPDRLTDKEYEEIKRHSVLGYEVLNDAEELAKIADFIKYHHEKWDGSGYPEGLKGEEIPVISRILALADAWNAMTSNRVYRDKLSKEEAIKELKDNKGTQFAPEVVEAALRLFAKGEL